MALSRRGKDSYPVTMLIPKKNRKEVYKYLFKGEWQPSRSVILCVAKWLLRFSLAAKHSRLHNCHYFIGAGGWLCLRLQYLCPFNVATVPFILQRVFAAVHTSLARRLLFQDGTG